MEGGGAQYWFLRFRVSHYIFPSPLGCLGTCNWKPAGRVDFYPPLRLNYDALSIDSSDLTGVGQSSGTVYGLDDSGQRNRSSKSGSLLVRRYSFTATRNNKKETVRG